MPKRPKRGKYILIGEDGLPIAKPTEGKRAPRGGLLIQDKSSVAESMGSTRPNRVSQATKLTGLSADQMNALDPAELFGMLPTALGKMVLTPSTTGVKVGQSYETTIEQVGHLMKILKRQQKMAVNGRDVMVKYQLDPSEIYTPRVYHMEGDRFTSGDLGVEDNPVVLLQQAIDDLNDYLDYGTLKGGKYSKYVSIKTEIPVVKVPTLKELGMTRFVMYTRPLKEAISEFLDQLNDVNAAARKRLG